MKAAIALLLSLLALAAQAATIEALPSDTLVARGKRFMARGESRDSALICFSIVARRYYKQPSDRSQHEAAAEAMRYLGFLMMTTDVDYDRAYEYTATAIALAEEDSLYGQLPYLYMSMANLWDMSSRHSSAANNECSTYLMNAYKTAVEYGFHDILPMIATDMAVVDLKTGKEGFAKELADFQRRRLPASAPYLAYSRNFVAATQARLRGQHAKAEDLYHRAAASTDETVKGYRAHATAENMAADVREAAGDLAGARYLLLANLQYIKSRQGIDDFLEEVFHKLSRNYESAGMPDSARIYDYQYLKARERLESANMPDMRALNFMKQIDRVNAELRLMSVKRQKSERWLLWSMSAGAVLILIVAGILLAWRWQRRHARELYHQNLRLIEAEQNRRAESEPPKTKYGRLTMEKSVTDDIYRSVVEVMETSDEVYQPGYTLARLAEQTGFKAYLVSQAINEKSGGSFSQLLSARRVAEASRKLASPEYDNITIEALATSVGMQSRSSFTRIFKSITGLSPAEFRRQAQAARSRK